MRVATAGLLLAAVLMTSACSNKAASSTDASATAAATAADASNAATAPTDTPAAPADASGATATPGMTVHTKDGDATIGGSVDTSKLGAPVYPGATTDPNSQGSLSASSNTGSTVIATYQTPDTFDKVYDYYKSQMPAGSEGMKMSMGGISTAAWQVGKDGGPDIVLVQVTSDKDGKVKILISHVIRTDISPAPSPT
jgi:hypothetical protein